MPDTALKPCAYPGCPRLVARGYCDIHRRCQPDYHKPDHQRLYNTARWKQLRRRQLAYQPWCADCLTEGYYVQATDVDHVKPHKGDERLFYDANNLQSLCHVCHSRKTAEELRARREGG